MCIGSNARRHLSTPDGEGGLPRIKEAMPRRPRPDPFSPQKVLILKNAHWLTPKARGVRKVCQWACWAVRTPCAGTVVTPSLEVVCGVVARLSDRLPSVRIGGVGVPV